MDDRRNQGQTKGKIMAKTVLIVEDNELNMKLFRDLLEAHGIGTLETRNGMEVLQIARDKRPDLILMDIQLPEVSGLDVTKWLKADEDLKSIPVIAVTAFAMKGDEEKIRQGGCEDYISKPISVGRFLEVINTYLDRVPAEAVSASTPIEAATEASEAVPDESLDTAPEEDAAPEISVEDPSHTPQNNDSVEDFPKEDLPDDSDAFAIKDIDNEQDQDDPAVKGRNEGTI